MWVSLWWFFVLTAADARIKVGRQNEEESGSFDADDSCKPIHARAWGMTLVCCGSSASLPQDCKYNLVHLCTYVACTCTLIIDVDNVSCTENVPVAEWKDHAGTDLGTVPFLCRNPNFPNADAEFSATLNFNGLRTLRSEFLLGLSRYKITEMEISVRTLSEIPDTMFSYFRSLTRMKIWQVNSRDVNRPRQQLRLLSLTANMPDSFANMKHLDTLTVQNVSTLIFPDTVAFVDTLRYLQISNCGLKTLPAFVGGAQHLEYLKVTYTNVTDISPIGKLVSLKLCFLSHNRIRDLSNVRFENRLLRDLDLSYNHISAFSAETFIGLTALTFLDLSNNYFKRLPGGVFANLRELKWLYLHHDFNPTLKKAAQNGLASLETLTANHFVGLANLEYLSLANNPMVRLDSTTLAPLENLLSLDLKHCNLSALPETLVHSCQLKYLYLNFNSLKRDSSFPPSVFAHLVQRLEELDLNENQIEENAHAFFLIPPAKATLIESLLFALKQQPVWWTDQCTAYHWWLYLVDSNVSNANRTLKVYYQKKFAFAANQTLSAYEKQLCNASYAKIMRESRPYSKLAESGACFRLAQERAINHQLRRQLVQLSRPKEAVYFNADVNKSQSPMIVESQSPMVVECNRHEPTSTAGMNVSHADDAADCLHLYDNINLLGYLLAANFAVLLIVCLCCVITFCKRQSATSNVSSSSTYWRN